MKRSFVALIVLILAGLACQMESQVSQEAAAAPTKTAGPAAAHADLATPETAVLTAGEPVLICSVTGNLHIRTAPDPDAQVVSWLYPGDMVVVDTTKYGEWRAVQFGSVSGYAHGSWLDCGGE